MPIKAEEGEENFIGREGISGRVRVGTEEGRRRMEGKKIEREEKGGRGKKKGRRSQSALEDWVKCSLT